MVETCDVCEKLNYQLTFYDAKNVWEIRLEWFFTGFSRPDIILVLFREGLLKEASRIQNLTRENTLYISRELLPIRTQARIKILDFSEFGRVGRKKEKWALMALTVILKDFRIYPLDGFKEAAALNSNYARENLAAIQAASGG